MFNINKMPRTTRVVFLVVALSISGLILLYVWILSFDFKPNVSGVLDKNKNLQSAVENIKTLPSFWQVIKSNGETVLNFVKDSLNSELASSSEINIEEEKINYNTEANIGNAMPQLPLSD